MITNNLYNINYNFTDERNVMERHKEEYMQELRGAVLSESEYTSEGIITDFTNFKRSTKLKLVSLYIKANEFDNCHFEKVLGFLFHDMLEDCSQTKILDFGKSLINESIRHYTDFIQYDIDNNYWDFNTENDDYELHMSQMQWEYA